MSSILKRFNTKSKKVHNTTTTTTTMTTTPSSPVASLSSWSPFTDYFEERDSRDIEKVFRYIDENGDGKISPADLRKCVKAVGTQRLSVEEATAAVECSDSDGDGLLSIEDFGRLMQGNGLSEKEKREELREAFFMYNDKKNDSGFITPKSLKRMLTRLGEPKSIHECKAMIRVYDLNGDGVLSFEEFAIMMRWNE